MKSKHRQDFRVRSYETDPLDRLQIPILCKLMQEAATAHAALLGVSVGSLIDDGVAWVLTRLQLEMDGWPETGDEVVIETWPEAMNRLSTERRFRILDQRGNTYGRASTLWLVFDLEKRRPVRIPPVITRALARHGLEDNPVRPGDLDPPDRQDHETSFTVRRSDLDRAGHVNNTSFIEWVVEAVPDAVWKGHQLAELEVRYLSECHHGQTVVSSTQVDPGDAEDVVRHSLVRRDDGDEVVRAKSVWRAST